MYSRVINEILYTILPIGFINIIFDLIIIRKRFKGIVNSIITTVIGVLIYFIVSYSSYSRYKRDIMLMAMVIPLARFILYLFIDKDVSLGRKFLACVLPQVLVMGIIYFSLSYY